MNVNGAGQNPVGLSCSRCGRGPMVERLEDHSERYCVTCGNTQYGKVKPPAGKTPRMRLRYVGDSPRLSSVIVICLYTPSVRSSAKVLQPKCPWCGHWMEWSDAGSKTRALEIYFWRCWNRHTVRITPDGWDGFAPQMAAEPKIPDLNQKSG